jgi:hypothetical protein
MEQFHGIQKAEKKHRFFLDDWFMKCNNWGYFYTGKAAGQPSTRPESRLVTASASRSQRRVDRSAAPLTIGRCQE